MPFCRECGAELPGRVKFCGECGATQTQDDSGKAGPTYSSTTITDPALLKRKWAVRKEEVVSSMPNAYETLVGEREADQRKKEIELDKKEREQERAMASKPAPMIKQESAPTITPTLTTQTRNPKPPPPRMPTVQAGSKGALPAPPPASGSKSPIPSSPKESSGWAMTKANSPPAAPPPRAPPKDASIPEMRNTNWQRTKSKSPPPMRRGIIDNFNDPPAPKANTQENTVARSKPRPPPPKPSNGGSLATKLATQQQAPASWATRVPDKPVRPPTEDDEEAKKKKEEEDKKKKKERDAAAKAKEQAYVDNHETSKQIDAYKQRKKHMSMLAKTVDPTSCSCKLEVLSYEIKYNKEKPDYVLFRITVEYDDYDWEVFRQFKQFEDLDGIFRRNIKNYSPSLPASGKRFDEPFLVDRHEGLQGYIKLLQNSRSAIFETKAAGGAFLRFIAPTQMGDVKPPGFIMPFKLELYL